MPAFVTQPAPDFKATAVVNGQFAENFTLSQFRGRKVVLFFYPLDFTFVCPTEILAFSDAIQAFKARHTEVIGISVDSPFSHTAWANTERGEGGITGVAFPLVSDLDKSIAADYGVLLPEGLALRGLFIINEKGILKHVTINDNAIGRNVDEVLRVLDAVAFAEQHGEVCPANWKPGDKAMKATSEGLKAYVASR